MDWKKIAVIAAAVLAAGWLGARLGGSDQSGTALAGGGGGNDKMIALATDVQNGESKLILVNTSKQKILVYKLVNGNDMGLIVVRGYEYDQELQYTKPGTPGNGFDFEYIRRLVEEDRKAKAAAGGMQ